MVTDIPGAFLHTDMEGVVHMVLEGEIAKLIVNIELKTYNKYVLWHCDVSNVFVETDGLLQ